MNPSLFVFGSCLSCSNRLTGDLVISQPGGETIRTGQACRKYLLPDNCQRDQDTAMCNGWKPSRMAE